MPIVSAIDTYKYNLAKFLIPLLQSLTANQYTVKDSLSFVTEISSLSSQPYYTAGCDIFSLFTLDESINFCVRIQFNNRNTILHNHLRKLLKFAVKNNHVMLYGKLSDHVDGVAKGLSSSGTSEHVLSEGAGDNRQDLIRA